MRVLALDTTSRSGSVAIVEDDRMVAEYEGDPGKSHAERLPADILAALEAARCSLAAIDVFAVASGPGSFTGLRIGIAAIQGLAVVRGARVVPVSALEALAEMGSRSVPCGTLVASWMDAYRGEVFSALYRVGKTTPFIDGRLEELDPPSVGDPGETWARWKQADRAPALVAGDGAVRYAALVPGEVSIVKPAPLAPVIARLAVARARAGRTVGPAGIQPLYVRRPDAETARKAIARRNAVDAQSP